MFLSISDVLKLHKNQIEIYGGTPGIRDIPLLKSAVCIPQATYSGNYLHADIYEMASAYLFHIVKNHPFVDGNKRTGLITSTTFLELNNYKFNAPNKILIKTVLKIAEDKMSKSEITIFIKLWSKNSPI